MRLIIGLGNPGEEYKNTRHNAGFLAIAKLQNCEIANFSDWKLEKRLKSEISKGEIDGEKIILAKPQTFMNNSGQAVKLLIKQYSLSERSESKGLRQAQAISLNNLWVIHDDLDLPLGTIKISFAASSAGHHGVESIINSLGAKDFWRLRIGIGPKIGAGEKFVLKPFKKTEQSLLNETLDQAAAALLLALKDPKKAMSEYNK
ncbi:MAG: aminoacyl-tRNA hydrolase [bacterium]|nr:aminoacyl-tRNA hydrolase [bacterium]